MNAKSLLSVTALCGAMFVATLTAQTDASKGKMGQMKAQMKDKMKAKMQAKGEAGMMDHHSEIAQLVDKVAQTFAAIQPNAEPATLRQQLATHEAAIKALQAKVAEHGKMMEAEQAAAAKQAEPAAPADPHAGHH
jgi:hypothetical protein